jgi:hypothetical protein
MFRSKKKENYKKKKSEMWNENFARIMKEKRNGLYARGFSSS